MPVRRIVDFPSEKTAQGGIFGDWMERRNNGYGLPQAGI